jgi:hypothetical protein
VEWALKEIELLRRQPASAAWLTAYLGQVLDTDVPVWEAVQHATQEGRAESDLKRLAKRLEARIDRLASTIGKRKTGNDIVWKSGKKCHFFLAFNPDDQELSAEVAPGKGGDDDEIVSWVLKQHPTKPASWQLTVNDEEFELNESPSAIVDRIAEALADAAKQYNCL